MTATETWVRDAGVVIGGTHLTLADALLDKTSWPAVGKTRGWREKTESTFEAEHTCWQAYWTGFYGHLADGLTIDEALSALENKEV